LCFNNFCLPILGAFRCGGGTSGNETVGTAGLTTITTKAMGNLELKKKKTRTRFPNLLASLKKKKNADIRTRTTIIKNMESIIDGKSAALDDKREQAIKLGLKCTCPCVDWIPIYILILINIYIFCGIENHEVGFGIPSLLDNHCIVPTNNDDIFFNSPLCFNNHHPNKHPRMTASKPRNCCRIWKA
jgi:hypothetical protein